MEFLAIYSISILFSHTTSIVVNRRMRIDLAKIGYKFNYEIYNLNKINEGYYKNFRIAPYLFPINILESMKLMYDYLTDPYSIIANMCKCKQIIELSSKEKEILEKDDYNTNSILKMSSKNNVVNISTEFVNDVYSELMYQVIKGNATDEELFNICIKKINELHPDINIDPNNPAFQEPINNAISAIRIEAKPFCKYNIYDSEGNLVIEKKYSDEEAKIIIYPVLGDIIDALSRLDNCIEENNHEKITMQDKIKEIIIHINRNDFTYDDVGILLYVLMMKWYQKIEESSIAKKDLNKIVRQIENAIREVNFYGQKEPINKGHTYSKKHK